MPKTWNDFQRFPLKQPEQMETAEIESKMSSDFWRGEAVIFFYLLFEKNMLNCLSVLLD